MSGFSANVGQPTLVKFRDKNMWNVVACLKNYDSRCPHSHSKACS